MNFFFCQANTRMLTKNKPIVGKLNQHRKDKLKLLKYHRMDLIFHVTGFINNKIHDSKKRKNLDLRRNFQKCLQGFPEFWSVVSLSTGWIIPESVIHIFGTAHLNHNKNWKMWKNCSLLKFMPGNLKGCQKITALLAFLTWFHSLSDFILLVWEECKPKPQGSILCTHALGKSWGVQNVGKVRCSCPHRIYFGGHEVRMSAHVHKPASP